jgi:two-component system OmpR family response regulator
MRILSVGVDEELSRSLASSLRVIVDDSYDIDDSSNFLRFRNYDLILLDYDLEYNKAKKFITKISKEYKVPLIILSIIDDKDTEIAFLKAGADDFIKEPFDLDIICARVEAKLRRTIDNRIKIGKLTIDIGEEKTSYRDKEIEIKGKPFDILVYLAEHKNQVISKDRLLNAIWEEPEFITPNDVETSINPNRQKLDNNLGIKCIETIRRRGYKFCYVDKEAS